MNSPTSRSLALLKKEGFSAQVVEKWNPYARIRQDLFGFIDIIAVGNSGTVGVQTTSKVNITTRIKKILTIPEAKVWLKSGNKIVVHGWEKKAIKGKRQTYQVDVREITLKDLEPVLV